MLSPAQVAVHNNQASLWLIVAGKAYDLTDFQLEHPGGNKILLKYAGKDATEAYEPIHPPGTLEQYLPKDKHLGDVDMTGVVAVVKEVTQEEKERQVRIANRPPLDECLSLYDFEVSFNTLLITFLDHYFSTDSLQCGLLLFYFLFIDLHIG